MLTLEPLELVFTDVRLHQVRHGLRHTLCKHKALSFTASPRVAYENSTGTQSEAAHILLYNPGSIMHSNRAESEASRVAGTQAYTQTVTLTNNLRATVEATIRAGSSERYTLSPASVALRPGQSAEVEVVLRVLKYAARRKAAQAGQRDIFHIRVTAPPPWMLRGLPYLPITTRESAAGGCCTGSARQEDHWCAAALLCFKALLV